MLQADVGQQLLDGPEAVGVLAKDKHCAEGEAVELCGWTREKEEETDGHSTMQAAPGCRQEMVSRSTPPGSRIIVTVPCIHAAAALVGRLTLLFGVLVSQDVNHRLRLQPSECSGQAAEVTGACRLTIHQPAPP